MKLMLAIKSLNGPGGGAEKVFVEVANGLHERGHEVNVLTFDFPGEPYYSLSSRIPRLDMAFCPPGKPMPRVAMLRALPYMRAAFRREQPDMVVAFMHSTYVPVGLAMIGLPIPLIASEHTEARHYESRPWERRLRVFIDRRATLRTVPSETVRTGYRSGSQTPIEVIANPVDSAALNVYRSAMPMAPPVVVSVGSFREEKDHGTLIDAFAQVSKCFPDWRLRIIGDGPLIVSHHVV